MLFDRGEKILLLFVGVGLLAALWAGGLRQRVETANRGVEIIVDGGELLALSEASGRPPIEVAQHLKAAGATCLAANEVTLKGLAERGDIVLSPLGGNRLLIGLQERPAAAAVETALRSKRPRLEITSPAGEAFLRDPLKWLRGGDAAAPRFLYAAYYSPYRLLVKGDLEGLTEIHLYLDAKQVEMARAANLRLAARLVNEPLANPQGISYSLSAAKRDGADLVIFGEEEVLGYDGLIDYTAGEMKRLGLLYGWVELAEQRGEEKMLPRMWDHLLRVHGISDKEMPRLSRSRILTRLVRAARERDIRACYARLLLGPQQDLLGYNADYIGELANRLKVAGLSRGNARPYPPLDAPWWVLLLLRLGIAGAATLLAGRLLPLRRHGRMAAYLLIIMALFPLRRLDPLLARQVWSLLAGLAFPTLGLVLAWQAMRASVERSALSVPRSERSPLLQAAVFTVAVSLFTLIGGLFVSAMLTETRFLVGAEQFRGVKLLLVGPAFIVALAILGGLSRPVGKWAEWRQAVGENARAFLCRPSLVVEVLLFLAALGAVGLLVVRSGNAAAAASPGGEQQAREWLETLLWARPRTKEFLLGYPALLLFFVAWLRLKPGTVTHCLTFGRLGWSDALLVVAAVGQASVVDTFCHLHTPLLLSLVRSLNGLWLGLLMGVAFGAIWLALGRGQVSGSGCQGK